MTETLMNGIPLDPRVEPYEFITNPPFRTGDEALIRTPSRREVHVIWLRGTRRKRWLVEVPTLKAYIAEDQRRKIAALHSTHG